MVFGRRNGGESGVSAARDREKEQVVQSSLVQFVMMGIFFGVIALIPILWFVLGIKSYGTGDYHQP
jgi:hypothetical protein